MKNLNTFEDFKFKNPFKRNEEEPKTLPPVDGKILVNVLKSNGNSRQDYIKDSIVSTRCHIKDSRIGKISQLFTNIGTDEEGRLIANCTNCGAKGVLLSEHSDRIN